MPIKKSELYGSLWKSCDEMRGGMDTELAVQTASSGGNMKKATRRGDDIRAHYDFTGGIRGKYAQRYAEGTNVVVLDPDVARLFPNREAVNETLRAVTRIVQIQERRQGRANQATAADRCPPAARKERERTRSGGK